MFRLLIHPAFGDRNRSAKFFRSAIVRSRGVYAQSPFRWHMRRPRAKPAVQFTDEIGDSRDAPRSPNAMV